MKGHLMAAKDSNLNIQELNDNFFYQDGKLFWKSNGKEAGWIDNFGYKFNGFKGETYKTHRLIFFMHHGYLPKFVDHIDNDRLNNRIENLRAATASQNSWNQRKRSTNTTGIKGISWSERSKRWRARCMVNYKSYFVGSFKTIDEAANAIKAFRAENHKEFARHS